MKSESNICWKAWKVANYDLLSYYGYIMIQEMAMTMMFLGY